MLNGKNNIWIMFSNKNKKKKKLMKIKRDRLMKIKNKLLMINNLTENKKIYNNNNNSLLMRLKIIVHKSHKTIQWSTHPQNSSK